MATIFAQMGGDAVGTGLGGHARRTQWVGMGATAGVADGRHVVDIDTKARPADHCPLSFPACSLCLTAASILRCCLSILRRMLAFRMR